MAYTDYDVEYSQYNEGGIQNQPDANAYFNSSLANPLTTTGSYCRQHFHTPAGGFVREKNACLRRWIKATIASGAFVNTPSTKSISLRTRVRWSHTGAVDPVPFGGLYGSQSCIGVAAFAPIASSVNAGGGYELMLQNAGTPGAVRLVLRAGPALASRIDGDQNVQVVCTGSYSPDLWYHIRMDVIPNGPNQKTITAHTSSDDGDSWIQVGSMVFQSTDGSLWLTTGRCGFVSMHANNLSPGNAPQSLHYIDDFEAFEEDV